MKFSLTSAVCLALVFSLGCGDDGSDEVETRNDDDATELDASVGGDETQTQDTDTDEPTETEEETEEDTGEETDTDEPATDDVPDPITIEGPDGGVEIEFGGEGVECGTDTCYAASVTGLEFASAPGCCADEATSSCGLDMSTFGLFLGLQDPGCEPLDSPGVADSSCEDSAPIMVFLPDAPAEGFVLAGCCQANGECGFAADFGSVGFGCVGPERFGQEPTGSCDAAQ